jgi:hypothetical protein
VQCRAVQCSARVRSGSASTVVGKKLGVDGVDGASWGLEMVRSLAARPGGHKPKRTKTGQVRPQPGQASANYDRLRGEGRGRGRGGRGGGARDLMVE